MNKCHIRHSAPTTERAGRLPDLTELELCRVLVPRTVVRSYCLLRRPGITGPFGRLGRAHSAVAIHSTRDILPAAGRRGNCGGGMTGG